MTLKITDDSDNMMMRIAVCDISLTLYNLIYDGYISTLLSPVLDYDESSPQH